MLRKKSPGNTKTSNRKMTMRSLAGSAMLASFIGGGFIAQPALARELPSFDKVSEGYSKVVSTVDGGTSLYDVYRKENDLLAVLPRNFASQRLYVATSVAGGSTYTGWQLASVYCYWKRVNDDLMLMEPELQYQSRGSEEITSSVKRTFTDRMILSVPIVAEAGGGAPVIDLDNLLVGQSGDFALRINPRLTSVSSVKAFPENLEITFEGPGDDGRLVQIHYSISEIPRTTYKPREADERIGYFLTVYKDFDKEAEDGKQFVRYINRWNIKKRDSSLAMSPPEEPVIFYIEHTVPVKYRRYVRDGILEWNKAFEEIGIDGAIEVRQQDARTGAYMDHDPEDVRYNFFRWITSERAFAMGPSRVNPETGEILDADIIFDDSMARYYVLDYKRLIASLPVEDADPDTDAFLRAYPHWDPRNFVSSETEVLDSGTHSHLYGMPTETPGHFTGDNPRLQGSGHVCASCGGGASDVPGYFTGDNGRAADGADSTLLKNTSFARVVQQNRQCNYAAGAAHQMNLARAMFLLANAGKGKGGEEGLLDGVPEEFVGQIIKEIVTHEVGHTLGLRHNFKASSWKSLEQLNSEVGQAQSASVMDYNPINIAPEDWEQGDWVTSVIGPYDYWAIEYGYTTDDKKLPEIVKRVAESGLAFATDEDTSGPDPYVILFDLGDDLIAWGDRQVNLVNALRAELLDRAVKDGQPWYTARDLWEMLMYEQTGAINAVARYVGGIDTNRHRKGDPNGQPPLVPVSAERQREAMEWLITNSFKDEAFGITAEIMPYLAVDSMRHWGNNSNAAQQEYPIHDRILNVQRGVLVRMLNPSTLRRVYDAEMMVPADQDAYTLPEHMTMVTEAVWSEVLEPEASSTKFTNRTPMISSLRRNLQREYVTRLIDLSQQSSWGAPRPVQALSKEWLSTLNESIGSVLDAKDPKKLDDYTRSHLKECQARINAALNAQVNYAGN